MIGNACEKRNAYRILMGITEERRLLLGVERDIILKWI
jgi:hypothetical protein